MINKVLFNNIKYVLILVITVTILASCRYLITSFWQYEIYAILFVFMVLLLSMKINLRSPILKWFGDNLFWVYILQRIPMIYFKEIGLSTHAYRYSLVVFICTILLAYIFKNAFDKPIDRLCNNIFLTKLRKNR